MAVPSDPVKRKIKNLGFFICFWIRFLGFR